MFNKNRIKTLILISFIFLSTSMLFAQYDFDYLEENLRQELQQNGIIFSKSDKFDELKLIVPELSSTVERDLRKIGPNVISEALLIVYSENPREEDLQYLLNEFIKVDRLDTIYYYNPAKDTDNLLFSDSYRVEGIKNLEPIDNLIIDTNSTTLNCLVYQDFKPIGPMVSKYEFIKKSDSLEMTVWNETPMKGSFINIISRKKFYSRVVILPMDGGFLFYGIGAVRLFNPFNILGNKIDPFYYRISGIFQWYMDEILLPMAELK